MTDAPNAEMAAIGRFVMECLLRSERTSLILTLGFRAKRRGRGQPMVKPRREFYVTARIPHKVVVCSDPNLGLALERLLVRLRG